jgi:alanine racemase
MSFFDQFTTYVVVDLDAIASNAQALQAHIGPDTELFGVVKDDGYGHGAIQIARVALESGATRLAVGRVDEGVQLRRAGLTAPVLIMCYTVPPEAEAIVEHDLSATVTTLEGAQALSRRAEALGKTVTVHVKVDTGMGRYGLLPDEVLPFLEQIGRLPGLDLEGIFTHFATADRLDKTYARRQFALFTDILSAVEAAGYHFRLRHAANSAATLDMPETHLDAVRPGIALYGLYPSAEVSRDIPLKPALSLKSHVARVRTLPPGEGVSYGRAFVTSRPTPIALVPVGYGDGYLRILSGRAHVLIRGHRSPIAGRICMDQLMIDVSGIEGVCQDDEVVLIGRQGNEVVSVEELARLAETINYEIVTGVSRRIPRIYMRGGQVQTITRLTAPY